MTRTLLQQLTGPFEPRPIARYPIGAPGFIVYTLASRRGMMTVGISVVFELRTCARIYTSCRPALIQFQPRCDTVSL